MRHHYQILTFGIALGIVIGLMLGVVLGVNLVKTVSLTEEQCAEGVFMMPGTGLVVDKVLVCAKEPRLVWPDIGPQPPSSFGDETRNVLQ